MLALLRTSESTWSRVGQIRPFCTACQEPCNVVGVYSLGSPSAGIKLTLSQDGTYRFHTFAGLETSRGVWRLDTDKLTLTSGTIPGEVSLYRVDDAGLHRIHDDSVPFVHSVSPQPLRRDVTRIPMWAKVAPEQIAEAKKHGVSVAFENDLGMRFVLIPAGTFLMGASEDEEGRLDVEAPQHTVAVPAFHLSVTEVTEGQFAAFLESPRFAQVNEGVPHPIRRETLPRDQAVANVWYDEVIAFADWLSVRDSGRTYRLPSEAEWEYACRAGTTSRFSFGDALSVGQAAIEGSPEDAATSVGRHTPNAWGLFDMHGGVWEMCADSWHLSYEGAPADGSAWIDERMWECVMRGGGCDVPAALARSATRRRASMGMTYGALGFRLVSPLPEPR